MQTKEPISKEQAPLSPDLLQRMDAYWRAANYCSVGQIYLCDNALLRRPLELSDVKPIRREALECFQHECARVLGIWSAGAGDHRILGLLGIDI